MKKWLFFLSFCILILPPLSAQQLIQSNPETAGMSSEKLARLGPFIENYIDQNALAGGVFLIARKGKIVYHQSFGQRSTLASTPYQNDDIFRIASMTKAITTVSIMQLYEQGKIGLDDPIHYYVPAFKDMKVLDTFNKADSTFTTRPAKTAITIRHLLTHTSGIVYGDFDGGKLKVVYAKHQMLGVGLSHKDWTTEELVNKLAAVPLAFEPGEKYTYGLNMEVLGRIVEVVSGMNLTDYFQNNIFTPLGIKMSVFHP